MMAYVFQKVLGKMPQDKIPPGKMTREYWPLENCLPKNSSQGKLPPRKLPLGKLPPRKVAPEKLSPMNFFCEFFLISSFCFYENFRP